MSTTAIEITGIVKNYGGIKALRGVDLEVEKGCLLGVVGPNGAGKTTLFSILCGYIAPTSGAVSFDGKRIKKGQPPVLLATYPQDALMLDGITVKRHLIYYAKLSGFSANDAKNEASRVLHLVKLPEVWERHPKTLSHGQRKRVGLAQAFIGQPDIIILDEPTAGLDPTAAREIRIAIREAAENRTVLVSSHDLDSVQNLCSDVAIIDQGRIARVERMATLTEAGGKVSFKLPERPSDTVIGQLQALDYVSEVTWDSADARLRIECSSTRVSVEAAAGELVQFLLANAIRFADMQVGQRLTDVVREETGG